MELVIENVTKTYRAGVTALSDVTLRLRPGVTGLLGPNGAGKSTLMRIVATIARPTAGQITWDGADIARDPDALRRTLGYLPQDFGVYPQLNPVEFLRYVGAAKGLSGAPLTRRIDDLLALVNLTHAARRALGGFSGGMLQRVGIAQALLGDPRLLIVDEPTTGLDPEERARFRNLLTDLGGERVVILSTHIVSDVESTAESIVMIKQGRVVAHATPAALQSAAAGHAWEWNVPAERAAAAREGRIISASVRHADGLRLRVISQAPPAPQAEPVAPTLEDAYMLAMAGQLPAASAA